MFKNKKWIFFLIILFPSAFWVILETSTINSNKLPFYGPKHATSGDTVYYSVKSVFEKSNSKEPFDIDTINYPAFVVMFIKDKYSDNAFRISGFWEYVNYKKDKIEKIPFILVCEKQNDSSATEKSIRAMAKKANNIFFAGWNKNSFDSINKTYFVDKPYYVDYSFFILVDKKRRIRGYYDSRYVAEVKRMLGEYQHLLIKEQKQIMIDENKIKQNN
ncbi:MAG: hypothetical protein KBG47_02665 [Bacteroidia bacterium]|nr:hypothetical protein [Sphingobacteriaceae bacterium]MBK7309495.1 hypothetical protein [Sphingobacteriaceae bacterium]MBP9068381.1 hypothetical protein [Bacteroidia bacterium]